MKNTISRKKRRLEKTGGLTLEVVTPRVKTDLKKRLSDYWAVYERSWKKAEPYPSFINSVCEYAWATGELRLGFAYESERAVAAQIWFVCRETAYIFKLAYDQEYRNLSVGSLVSWKLFEHVIEKDRIRCIDYLTGDDKYKRDWVSQRRDLYGVEVCNPRRWKGMLAMLRNEVANTSRRARL